MASTGPRPGRYRSIRNVTPENAASFYLVGK
jgi:hypothetical protein